MFWFYWVVLVLFVIFQHHKPEPDDETGTGSWFSGSEPENPELLLNRNRTRFCSRSDLLGSTRTLTHLQTDWFSLVNRTSTPSYCFLFIISKSEPELDLLLPDPVEPHSPPHMM